MDIGHEEKVHSQSKQWIPEFSAIVQFLKIPSSSTQLARKEASIDGRSTWKERVQEHVNAVVLDQIPW